MAKPSSTMQQSSSGGSPEARRRIANSRSQIAKGASSNPALGSERICYLLFSICYSGASFKRASGELTRTHGGTRWAPFVGGDEKGERNRIDLQNRSLWRSLASTDRWVLGVRRLDGF